MGFNGKVRGEFTPGESRVLALLSDGERHRTNDVLAALGDEASSRQTMFNHVNNIRAKIRPRGQDIVCELYKNALYYRHVRLLVNPAGSRA